MMSMMGVCKLGVHIERQYIFIDGIWQVQFAFFFVEMEQLDESSIVKN